MDIGWLLYSTHHQDEEHIANMMTLTGENIGVKWKPVCTISGFNRKKDPQDTSEYVYALHLECAADQVHEVQKKLSVWYDSSSQSFPDGTKMRLVPTFNSV
jgi:hypothetical protein